LTNTITEVTIFKCHVFETISFNEILKMNIRGDQNEALETAYRE